MNKGLLAQELEEMPGFVQPGTIVYTSASEVDRREENMSDEWEIDCYSRPVLGADGKNVGIG